MPTTATSAVNTLPLHAALPISREDEPGGNRLAVGAVAEGDRLRALCSEPADQLADRFGLAVRPWARRRASPKRSEIGGADDLTPVTRSSRMPTSACNTRLSRVA